MNPTSFLAMTHHLLSITLYPERTAKILYQKFETYILRKELRGPSPNFYNYVSVCDLYIPTIGLHILLQENSWTDCWNIFKSLIDT